MRGRGWQVDGIMLLMLFMCCAHAARDQGVHPLAVNHKKGNGDEDHMNSNWDKQAR